MNFINNKKIKSSALAGIIAISLSGFGYSLSSKEVTLVVKGKEKNLSTHKSNVKKLLDEQDVKYDGNDIVTLELDRKIKNGDRIEVIDVREQTIREKKEIPYETKIVDDKNLLKGNSTVSTEGETGRNELVYKITYYNGKKVDKKFIKEEEVSHPINKVIQKGIKEEVKVASSRGETTRMIPTLNSYDTTIKNYDDTSKTDGKQISVEATAYTGHNITSTGTKPKWGTIAVDPTIIPYGTKVYIPQFGKTFIAEDCGSAIKGNKIDIYMYDKEEVYNWGRKNIEVYIVE
ncbi:3D domain-containing protein [Romboutsia lituseburensis]|uniref:3D domain-containing protein n=1 Tax=Romboutsia lituseburensis TaxID=1537 RepID=UPI00215AB6DE|nr:3D domain-containing protein [Romboutsia lituseburensis]MCR8746544.1 3D domain-containing protein [Romboutsia lituseburensis]